MSEAYRLQMRQVIGPGWLDQNEYDLQARADHSVGREQLDLMLRTLLVERFDLKQHRETREMRVYELTSDRGGPANHPVKKGEVHFHGNMRQFADFLAVQLSIPQMPEDPTQPARAGGPSVPVLDKTGLTETYDFGVDIKPEPGADGFTLWQRALPQLGLKLESRRGPVEIIVIDSAAKTPAAN